MWYIFLLRFYKKGMGSHFLPCGKVYIGLLIIGRPDDRLKSSQTLYAHSTICLSLLHILTKMFWVSKKAKYRRKQFHCSAYCYLNITLISCGEGMLHEPTTITFTHCPVPVYETVELIGSSSVLASSEHRLVCAWCRMIIITEYTPSSSCWKAEPGYPIR
jgi:hypothetical protein